MKKYLFFLLISFFCFAQENFVPINNVLNSKKKELKSTLKQRFKLFNNKIKEEEKAIFKNKLLQYHKENQKYIFEKIDKNQYVFDSKYEKYTQFLIEDLRKNNSEKVSEDILLLFSQSTAPNASYIGYGIVVVNLGLFIYMDSYQQMQGAIAHEIGHQIENHAENTIKKNVERLLSQKLKNEIKQIENKNNNVDGLVENIYKKYIYEQKQIERENEFIADSLAFLLFDKSNYNPEELINLLLNIEDYKKRKESTFLKKETYQYFFNTPNQSFKNNWFKEDLEENVKDKEIFDKDSIDSHPLIKERITKIQQWIDSSDLKTVYDKNNEEDIKNKKFLNIKKEAIYQRIASLFYSKNYGRSLYHTLLLLQNEPQNKYLKEFLGKNISVIYKAKKENQLLNYIQKHINVNESEDYNLLLNFIWNLNIEELEAISRHCNPKEVK